MNTTRLFTLVSILTVALLLIAACGPGAGLQPSAEGGTGTSPGGDATPIGQVVGEAPSQPGADVTPMGQVVGGGPNPLAETTWQWVGSNIGTFGPRTDTTTNEGADTVIDGAVVVAEDGTVTVSEPTKFTLTFLADGTVQVQSSCNSGGGPYSVDGNSLTLGPMVFTTMACDDMEAEMIFVQQLNMVGSFRVEENARLFLESGETTAAAAAAGGEVAGQTTPGAPAGEAPPAEPLALQIEGPVVMEFVAVN